MWIGDIEKMTSISLLNYKFFSLSVNLNTKLFS